MPVTDSTQRFSSRVDNYVRYRPDYPAEVLDLLKKECGLTSKSVVADIASGTGIWTRWLLLNGNPVFGVEPNAEMRRKAERLLGLAEQAVAQRWEVYEEMATRGAQRFPADPRKD